MGKSTLLAFSLPLLVEGMGRNFPKMNVIYENILHRSEGGMSPPPYCILYILLGIFTGIVCSYILKEYRIPMSGNIFAFALGSFFGISAIYSEFMRKYILVKTPAAYLRKVFVPTAVFRTAVALNFEAFRRSWTQVMLITLVGLPAIAAENGFLMMLVVDEEWSYKDAFYYGSLVLPIYSEEIMRFLRSKGWLAKDVCNLLEAEVIMSLIVNRIILGFLHEQHVLFTIISPFAGLGIGLIFGKILVVLLRLIQKDLTNTLLAAFVFPNICDYITSHVLGYSGGAALLMMGFLISYERTKMSMWTDQYIVTFYVSLWKAQEALLYCYIGTHFTYEIVRYAESKAFALAMVALVLTIVTRFLTFLALTPLLSRMGYGLQFSSFMINIWGGIRSGICMIIAVEGSGESNLLSANDQTAVIVIFATLLSNLLCPPMMVFLWNLLIKTEGNSNLDNCIKHIVSVKDNRIKLLKLDRLLSDANWSIVRKETIIVNPDTLKKGSDLMEDDMFMTIPQICPECKKEVVEELTEQQLHEKLMDAAKKLLMVMKISFSRQYERGLLSESHVGILLRAVDVATEERDKYIRIEGLLKLFKRQTLQTRFILMVIRLMGGVKIRKPQEYWRRRCYYLVNHFAYKMIMNIVICATVCISILTLIMLSRYSYFLWPVFGVTVGLNFLYILEVALKIAAHSWIYVCPHGVESYFKDVINVFDSSMLLVGLIEIVLIIACQETYGNVDTIEWLTNVRYATNSIEILRILRLLRIFNFLHSRIQKWSKTITDSQTAFAYTMGKAFLLCIEDVTDVLDFLISEPQVRKITRNKLDADKAAISYEITVIQNQQPWMAVTVKTKQVMRTILSYMRVGINELVASGWANSIEATVLNDSLDKLYASVRSISTVRPSSPKLIFKELPWLYTEETISEFLYDKAIYVDFKPGAYICRGGEVTEGVFVVITGILKFKLLLNPSYLECLRKIGALPIMDSLPQYTFESGTEEFIISGNSVGVLSTLTKRPYSCDVIADTYTQTYLLTRDVLEEAINLSNDPLNGLKSRMWKSQVIRLCTTLLMKSGGYDLASQNAIQFLLEKSFVLIYESYNAFVINDKVEAVVLLEGIVTDDLSKVKYVGPACIPRHTRKIWVKDNTNSSPIEPILLIVPTKDATNYGLIVSDGDLSLFDNLSQKCFSHASKKKQSNETFSARSIIVSNTSTRRNTLRESSMVESILKVQKSVTSDLHGGFGGFGKSETNISERSKTRRTRDDDASLFPK